MVNQAKPASKSEKPATVTEVIADGMSVVLARPWMLLIPLLVDLYYWLGWNVTLRPALQSFRDWIVEQGSEDGPQAAEAVDELAGFDLTGIISFFVPTFFGGAAREEYYLPLDHSPVELSSLAIGFLAVIGLLVLGALLFGFFMVWIADAALGRGLAWSQRIRSGGAVAIRFLALIALVIGLIIVIVGPILMVWTFFALVGVDLRAIVLPLLLLLAAALLMLLYFAPEALVVSGSGPLQAMKLSARVVRRNFWQTLGLAVASLIIAVGLGEIWSRLAVNLPGVLLALIANAFVGCGLAAAAILFFNERWQLLTASKPSLET